MRSMLSLCVTLVLTQAPVKTAAVLDVSAPDAIYEDISRGLADDVVAALHRAGLDARRVEEGQLPEAGCREGPCLGQVAKDQHADVLVTLDAVDLETKGVGVAVTALKGRTGEPIAGGRYVIKPKSQKPPKELAAFATRIADAVGLPRADAGEAAPAHKKKK